jgi:hypothetical protein
MIDWGVRSPWPGLVAMALVAVLICTFSAAVMPTWPAPTTARLW